MIGAPELILILAVVLIVFGAGRLPEIGRTLPNAVKDFGRGVRGELPDRTEPVNAPSSGTTQTATRPAHPRPARKRSHPFRGLSMLAVGIGLLIYAADATFLNIGLPLQITSGVFVVVGVAFFFL